MLETSDTWSLSHLSHRPSEPVYYIIDWRISISHKKLWPWPRKSSRKLLYHVPSLLNHDVPILLKQTLHYGLSCQILSKNYHTFWGNWYRTSFNNTCKYFLRFSFVCHTSNINKATRQIWSDETAASKNNSQHSKAAQLLLEIS